MCQIFLKSLIVLVTAFMEKYFSKFPHGFGKTCGSQQSPVTLIDNERSFPTFLTNISEALDCFIRITKLKANGFDLFSARLR